MIRHFTHLNETQKGYIELVCLQQKSYKQVAEMLNVNYAEIQKLYTELDSVWRPISKLLAKYKSKNMECDFWDFYDWVKTPPANCHYCGVTQEELNCLHEIGIDNKRTTRGRTLEIDRKVANDHYSNLSNLTYSCYWCNNAKTDTFSEEEFKIIGKAIGQVWQQRLNK